MQIDAPVIMKAIVFVFILLSPFVDYSYLSWAHSVPAKMILLFAIVAASFYDLQLAILMTLAFLLLNIHLNREVVFGRRGPVPISTVAAPIEHFAAADVVSEFPDACDARAEDRDRISRDLYDLYIDAKIKPYEEYIRHLSDPSKLADAADSAMLQ